MKKNAISEDQKNYNYKAFVRAGKPFMTYQQIYGIEPNRKEVIKSIESLDLQKALILVSQLSVIEENVAEELKYKFLTDLANETGINIEKNKDEILFASQAILYLYKWLLAYGTEPKHIKHIWNIRDVDLREIIELSIQVSDFLPKDIEPDDFLLHVLSFSKHTDNGHEFARAHFIYTNLARDKNVYKENEFVDINKDFIDFYGYSIEQYLAANFYLLGLATPQTKLYSRPIVRSRDEYFKKTKLEHVAPKIIDDLSLNINEAKKWAEATIDNSWDYLEMQRYPLLKINTNEFIPFSYDVLANGIFDGLYHRIRNCYPKNDKRFLDFFGRPFEKYIEIILKEAIQDSKFNYEYIEEFDYGKKSSSLSSDFYLRLNENLIIIEAKAARPTVNSSIKGDKAAAQKDLKKLFVDPIIQADKTYQNIIESSFAHKFNGVKNLYIISVNLSSFPSVPSYYKEVEETLGTSLSDKVKGYFNFSITDIEAMCYLIARKGKKRPIFRYLDNKFKSPELQSFTWFLEHSSIPRKRSRWVNEKLYSSYEKIFGMLSENPSEPLEYFKKRLLK